MSIWKRVNKIAEESNCKKRHVGCVITDDNGVFISEGYNYHKNGVCDCFSKEGSTAIHAEIMAVNAIPIYNRNDKLIAYVNHEPCDRCQSILGVVCSETVINATSVKLKQQTDIEDTLEERSHTHGDFKKSSRFIQLVKAAMGMAPKWSQMDGPEKEALHMIQHKIGRIIYGDPKHVDNWHDIIGYAKLVEDKLNAASD